MIENRISKEEMFMRIAEIVSLRSTCKRLHVGAIIVDSSFFHVLSIGYNGNYAGGPNVCDSDEKGNCGCFPANVLVSTNSGFKKIQNIIVGDKVLTHENRYKKVTKIFKKEKYSGKYVYINSGISFGKTNRFVCTEEHPVLIERFDKIFWEKAINIKKGDTIFCLSKECCGCKKIIPHFREMCNDCFKKSSSSLELKKRRSERMKTNNPMKTLYKIKKIIISNNRVEKLVEKQKKGQSELEKIFIDHIKEQNLDKKYRCIIVDHTKEKPDIILIDFENKKVIAYEYEKHDRNVKKDKYKNNTQYDEVIWFVKNKVQSEKETYNNFSRINVTNIEIVKKCDQTIYNLEVEDDNSFVCQKIVVHNCIHSELNAIVKADNRIKNKILFVTHSPCLNCSKLIINSGFSKVFYRNEYRTNDGINLLKKMKIEVNKI